MASGGVREARASARGSPQQSGGDPAAGDGVGRARSAGKKDAASSLGNKPPLIVIVGPTAVGKTELSIQLAERLGGEIVSADSRLFYRGMDIGTAKPTLQERPRIPHHLIDVADPRTTWSLAVFQQAAAGAIAGDPRPRHLPSSACRGHRSVHPCGDAWLDPSGCQSGFSPAG